MRPDLCAVDNKISPRKYLGSFYTDSLVHDPLALKLLLDVIGKVLSINHNENNFIINAVFMHWSYTVLPRIGRALCLHGLILS